MRFEEGIVSNVVAGIPLPKLSISNASNGYHIDLKTQEKSQHL